MARTNLTKTTQPNPYSTSGSVLTLTAADAANGNQFTASGRDLVIARNSGASSHTVTISSTADPYGRTGDVNAQSVAAGAVRIFGPLPADGWRQTDGKIYVSADSAEVLIGILEMQ